MQLEMDVAGAAEPNLKRMLLKALPTLLRTCAKPSASHAAGVNVVPRYL